MLGGNRSFVTITAAAMLLIGLAPALTSALPAPEAPMLQEEIDLTWEQAPGPAGAIGWGIGGSTAGIVVSTVSSGSYVSHDDGNTWSSTPAGIDEGDIVFDPSDPMVGYYAGFGGLARTTDGGDSWGLVLDTDRSRVVTVSPEGTVAASQRFGSFENRILLSHDQGETWQNVGPDLPQFTSLYGLAFGPTEDHLLVMALGELWATDDGGQTWTHLEGEGGRWLTRAPDGALYRAGFGPLMRSTDGGFTWTEIGAPSLGPMTTSETGRLYIASNDGVLFTDDQGASWTNMGGEEISWAATGIIVDPSDPEAVLMSDEGVGVTWVGPAPGDGYRLEGRTTGFPPIGVDALSASQDGQVLMGGTASGVYQSRDAGDTWVHTGAGIGMDKILAVATADGQTLYAGGGNLLFQPVLLTSQDGGITWHTTIPELNDGRIVDIAVDPSDPSHAWAAAWIDLADSSVYETTDGGQTWARTLTMADKIRDVAYDQEAGMPLAATDAGVYARDPGDDTWTQRSLTDDTSRAIGAGQGHVYAHGPRLSLWTGVVDTTTLIPWADADGQPQEIHVDPIDGEQIWLVNNLRDLILCTPPVAGVPPGCQSVTDGSDDPGATSATVSPDGSTVTVATQNDGLFRAQVPR